MGEVGPALFYAMAVVALARLALCVVIVPILAAHDYELELTWTSISLVRARDPKRQRYP